MIRLETADLSSTAKLLPFVVIILPPPKYVVIHVLDYERVVFGRVWMG